MSHKSIIPLILAICLVLAGCTTETGRTTLNFYYCTEEFDFGPEDRAIESETRKEILDHLAYRDIIERYLDGPISSKLYNPFPNGTTLISITIEQQTTSIVLNNAFAQLTGINLTIACACLSLTVGEFTGCPKVQISAQNALLDNRQSITIDINELSFVDSVI